MFFKVLSIFLILFVWTFQFARADCFDISLIFSQEPNKLTIDELGKLRKCLASKITEKSKSSSLSAQKGDRDCKKLALKFSKEPDSLSVKELEVLQNCVISQLSSKVEEGKKKISPACCI